MSEESSGERPAVLIVGERWGSPFHGPTSGAMRHFAGFFHSLGLRVYCAVLKMTDQEYDDAKRNHVELIPPDPPKLLKKRTPSHDWLYAVEAYFPDILMIKHVKIVFGFALVTSAATLDIKDRVMATAKFYIGNLWSSDVRPAVLGCSKDELLDRLESLLNESEVSSALVSIDHQTFDHYQQKLQEVRDKQYLYSVMPDMKYLNSKQPRVPKEALPPLVLSFMDECDLKDMENHQLLGRALNEVTSTYDELNMQPPTWNILIIPEADELRIQDNLKPHPHLTIVPSSAPALKHIENEFRTCHLLLIPPSPGMNSLHLMLSAMALGIPFLVPKFSPCHEMIRRHFAGDLAMESLVADMTNVKDFADKIRDILFKRNVAWTKALEVKQHLQKTVVPALLTLNSDFRVKVGEDVGLPTQQESGEGHKGPNTDEKEEDRPGSDASVTTADDGGDDDNGQDSDNNDHNDDDDNKGKDRKPGHMHLDLNAAGGIPERGVKIKAVEQAYFQLPEVLEKTPQQINNLHPGLHVEAAEGHSVRYTIACKTLDALECLWKEYEALRINKLVTQTTITEKTLREIRASYFSIQTTLNIAEYSQCRKELQKDGEISATVPPTLPETGDDDREMSDTDSHLRKENKTLKGKIDNLETKIHTLQTKLVESESKVQLLNNALEENAGLKVNNAILQATVTEQRVKIEILEQNIAENEKGERVLVNKLIQSNAEVAKLKESQGREGDKSLSDENQRLTDKVRSLTEKVEDLEKKNIAKQEAIQQLEMKMDKIKGQWKKTQELYFKGEGVQGMTINHHGQVVMACRSTNRVLTLDNNFKPDDELRFDNQFAKKFIPWDVAVTTTDKYYMTDRGNNQIVVHDKTNNSTQTIYQHDEIDPTSISLLGESFVVIDDKGRRVIKYNQDGKYVAHVGGHVKPNLLIQPICVVVNSDGNVIVLDWVNGDKIWCTVQVFNSELEYLFTMYSGRDLYLGLTVDIWDNVYCVGRLNESTGRGRDGIAKYTKNGELLEVFGDIAEQIAIATHTQPILVTLNIDKKIQVYTK